MQLYLVRTPIFIQQIFNKYYWSFSFLKSSEKVIYLTFDDGPTPKITEWTLNTLKQYNATATFFCIGKNIKNHPNIVKKIIEGGHNIGNHTYNHLNGWKNNTETYLKNIELTENCIQSEINKKTKNSTLLFRPPYGKIKRKQANLLLKKGYKIIMWNVLSADFDQKITPQKCLTNVISNTKNGSIIVFHDSVKATANLKYALPKVLAHFSKKGYEFKHIALPR